MNIATPTTVRSVLGRKEDHVLTAPTEAVADPASLTASHLARAYDQYVAARWRGDDHLVVSFGDWLAAFWDDGPPEPAGPPAAVSLLAPVRGGIRWYETPWQILGYVRGQPRTCYQIPRTAVPPVIEVYG